MRREVRYFLYAVMAASAIGYAFVCGRTVLADTRFYNQGVDAGIINAISCAGPGVSCVRVGSLGYIRVGADGGSGVQSVTATAPITSSGGANPNIACNVASGAQAGCVSTSDWSNWSSKVGDVSGVTPITITGTSNSPDVNCDVASGSQPGCLSSSNWTTFNNSVDSVSGTAPIVSSGGQTPAISCTAASGSVAGCLSSADWTTFNGKATTGSCSGSQVTNSITSSVFSCRQPVTGASCSCGANSFIYQVSITDDGNFACACRSCSGLCG